MLPEGVRGVRVANEEAAAVEASAKVVVAASVEDSDAPVVDHKLAAAYRSETVAPLVVVAAAVVPNLLG